MSSKHSNNNYSHQTALKLLNQYADSYHLLQLQIEQLEQENKDLKSNLQINKEIIQSFFQGTNQEDKINYFQSKIKQENTILQSKIKNLESQLLFLKTNQNSFIFYKDKLDQYKTKIFLLENLLKEKENQIIILKKSKEQPLLSNNSRKTNSINDFYYLENTKGFREIYVSSPSVLLNTLNEELQYEKEINKQLLLQIQEHKLTVSKKDKQIQETEKHFYLLKQELTKYKQDKTNINIISQLTQYRLATKQNNLSSNSLNSNVYSKKLNKSSGYIQTDSLSHGSSSINKSRRSLINQIDNLQQVNKTKRKIGENNFDLTEEWYETLKYCNMTQEEYIKYCSNKQFTQLTDVIEYLYKLILDKNIQIRLLTEENDSLNLENLNISKRLLELSETIEKMMNNKHDVKARNYKSQTNNSTFVNVDGSAINVLDNDGVNLNIALDYLKEVKQSITSSEFQEGMILDQFDLVSEMSKDQKHFPQHDQDDTKEQSNGGENGINNNSKQDKIEIHLNQPMYSSYKKS